MVQIKHFTAPQKNAKFSVFKTCKMAVAGQNTRRPPARPENYCESKQTYFSYSLDKAFHLPEFQAKFFFTRNWVGGFYWDSLLNALPTSGSLIRLLFFHAPRGHIYLRFLPPPPPTLPPSTFSPQRRKPGYTALLRMRGNYFRPYLSIPGVCHIGAA